MRWIDSGIVLFSEEDIDTVLHWQSWIVLRLRTIAVTVVFELGISNSSKGICCYKKGTYYDLAISAFQIGKKQKHAKARVWGLSIKISALTTIKPSLHETVSKHMMHISFAGVLTLIQWADMLWGWTI